MIGTDVSVSAYCNSYADARLLYTYSVARFTCHLWSSTNLWDFAPLLLYYLPYLLLLDGCIGMSLNCVRCVRSVYCFVVFHLLQLLLVNFYASFLLRGFVSLFHLLGICSPCLLVMYLCQLLLEALFLHFNGLCSLSML